jgi:hypothetical protein
VFLTRRQRAQFDARCFDADLLISRRPTLAKTAVVAAAVTPRRRPRI